MYDLYQYLIFIKGYIYDEAKETEIRYDLGMDFPKEVLKDIRDYHNYRKSKDNNTIIR